MAKKKNNWNTVTPLSKFLALVMFLTFPFIGFYMGMQFQQELDKPLMREVYKDPESPPIEIPEGTACTMEARLCPDGSYVGRSGPNCEFEKCPGE